MTIKRGESFKRVRCARPKAAEPVNSSRAGKDQYLSRAVAKALEILQILQPGNGPMALNEVARRIQLSKASAFRLLRTLEAAGCLTASELGKYGPGTGCDLSGLYPNRGAATARGHPNDATPEPAIP